MASWLDIAVDFGVASLVGVAFNTVAKKLFPSDTIKGDPRWVYYLSIFAQTCIFPPLAFMSWREQGYTVANWFVSPWADLPGIFWTRMYMASLWGYWAKDMLVLSDPLIVVHHIA
eukprot:TRINITY_DN2985_c0_g1_i1.p1 TRINITY_DN2985_c0_g1~~TRINITY_DN2985_c0_g1_i1.p1  ORF type:complete len:115 (-),score=11.42 TRINITY_DN2985_c0_g1_i1:381-725(-)